MSVYIASMNMRGAWASPPCEDVIKINATSSQAKASKNRRDFSPMTHIENGYKGFWNFEHYWQSGKVFENIPHEDCINWWKALEKPKRRYPKAKTHKVLYATWDGGETKMDYITSRKLIYVPEYYNLIKNREMIQYYKQKYANGEKLVIYDYDGVRKENGEVDCAEISRDLLIEKINDETYPFGHGYIVGATIAGILPEEYIN